jgi:hypothetical protein
MKARLRKFLSDLGETFWLLPASIVIAGIVLALGLVHLDHIGAVPRWLNRKPLALQRRRHRRASLSRLSQVTDLASPGNETILRQHVWGYVRERHKAGSRGR